MNYFKISSDVNIVDAISLKKHEICGLPDKAELFSLGVQNHLAFELESYVNMYFFNCVHTADSGRQ